MSEPNIHTSSDDWNKLKHLVDLSAENASLKAEVERLTAEVSYDNRLQLHVDKLAAEFTQSEVERLKAEVERLTERNKFLEQIDSYIQGANENAYEKRCDELEAEVERLTELVESNLNSSKVAMSKSDTVLHERDRLKAEVERLKIYDYKNLSMRIEIDKLNAKINRLVKAGDKMVLCIDGDYNYQMPCVQAWNAAKEGKPSV